ncbi:hypothetical protein [Hymenobacter fodinae]|uniref:Uncharacterized protein n=1 Tax=Hymenobacter fodinae TaxID=2510796 RepID=A0A4Z0P1N9_9BACT|nr:hypothetical protein [Hymenobacter fodinae]TGE04660.1 hypothetical protein EU556_20970 [Hymenobacter fodinae]
MLKFDNTWRFASPGPISSEVLDEFFEIIGKIARYRQEVFEHFKTAFASTNGSVPSRSSNASWAHTDLLSYMRQASANAPLFIEAFYEACESLDDPTPDHNIINGVLAKHQVNYRIDPPELKLLHSGQSIAHPQAPPSLEESAQELIHTSFSESQKMLTEGRYRPAVQELLWLLETVSTAFQGLPQADESSIKSKYFNKIVEELRNKNQGTTLNQVLSWVQTLHGYLSAPAGGGIRHGMHLKEGFTITENEARLYCNLITSYITYLLAEHARLKS